MSQSDALVLFGATGDLAFKKIFPSLQYMFHHGRYDGPIIGVAFPKLSTEQIVARARESIETHGKLDPEAFAKLAANLSYVGGDCDRLSGQVRHPGCRSPAVIWGRSIAALPKGNAKARGWGFR
jgi:glucose-6-phosphate 1-dehydrogenase